MFTVTNCSKENKSVPRRTFDKEICAQFTIGVGCAIVRGTSTQNPSWLVGSNSLSWAWQLKLTTPIMTLDVFWYTKELSIPQNQELKNLLLTLMKCLNRIHKWERFMQFALSQNKQVNLLGSLRICVCKMYKNGLRL